MSNKRKRNNDYFNTINRPQKFYISQYDYLNNKLLALNSRLDLFTNNITEKLELIHRDINLLNTYINYKITFLENKINLYENNISLKKNNYNYYS